MLSEDWTAPGMPGTSRAKLLAMILFPEARYVGIGSGSMIVYVVKATQEVKGPPHAGYPLRSYALSVMAGTLEVASVGH